MPTIHKRLIALFASLAGALAVVGLLPAQALADTGSFSSYVRCVFYANATGLPLEYVTFRWHLTNDGTSRRVDILEFGMTPNYRGMQEVYDYEYNYGTGGKYGNGKDLYYSPPQVNATEDYTTLEMPYINNAIRARLLITFVSSSGRRCGYGHDI